LRQALPGAPNEVSPQAPDNAPALDAPPGEAPPALDAPDANAA
jgi:hypothetical protein